MCWVNFKKLDETSFKGIHLDDMSDFEQCFHICIDIYQQIENGYTQIRYRSDKSFSDHMDLHIWENHLSYIYNLNIFAKSYECESCSKLFYNNSHLKRHKNADCTKITRYKFKGGHYDNNITIFQQLEYLNIVVPECDRYQKDFLVFDFESILKPLDQSQTEKLTLLSLHIPVSVAICGTLPYQRSGLFMMNENVGQLIKEWIQKLKDWATDIRKKTFDSLGWVLIRLAILIRDISEELQVEIDSEIKDFLTEHGENEAFVIANDIGISMKHQDNDYKQYHLNRVKKIYRQMKLYINEVIVLSYHSSKYDINLVKRYLPIELDLINATEGFVIKRTNSYNLISNGSLRFLDICNYLSVGTSYSQFLAAYHVTERKRFFPYEHLTSYKVLYETELPPITSKGWYSTIKGKHILGDTDEERLANYDIVKKAWTENNMTTLASLLEWYNVGDVFPFVLAVERMQEFFISKGLNMFKDSLSLPGLGRVWLFQAARKRGVSFALFNEFYKSLYMKFKDNIVGGPSIIFRRYTKIGESVINKKTNNKVLNIHGYDACSMYGKAMDMEMPVNGFVCRKEETGFRPVLSDKYLLQYYWMDYISQRDNIHIQHKLNSGKEYRCGVYLCDGWCPPAVDMSANLNNNGIDDNMNVGGEVGGVGVGGGCLYEFIGCYIHGHPNCHYSRSLTDEERSLRWSRHVKKMNYIKSKHNVVIMLECEFIKEISMNESLKEFIRSKRPRFYQKYKGPVTMSMILKAVEEDRLFGALEIDLSIPEQWGAGKERNKSPYDYFCDMSPIFCTVNVPFDAIGEHMQTHAKKYNISKKPRTQLVGGMKAEKILIASKLLQWYLKHGMVVTRIYEVIEFSSDQCFSGFIKEVKEARREASLEDGGDIRALSMKLLCNSSYGGILLQKNKHKNVKFVKGAQKAKVCVNDRRFSSLITLCEESQLYEVSSYKKRIDLNMPIYLGFFILQYAKLILLSFFYDFLKEFIEEDCFSLLHCDTDSCYIAISEENLIDIVKPEKIDEFYKAVYGSCDDSLVIEPGKNNHFLPRQCCEHHRKYDEKEPGIFKLEFQGGKEAVGLSSKSYILITDKKYEPSQTPVSELYRQLLLNKAMRLHSRGVMKRIGLNNTKPGKRRIKWYYKLVSKGVSKKLLKQPVYTYRHVIKTQERKSCVNKGFRMYDNDIYSYVQHKSAFSYYYTKRVVQSCGVETKPLDITLRPIHRPLANFAECEYDDTDTFDSAILDVD